MFIRLPQAQVGVQIVWREHDGLLKGGEGIKMAALVAAEEADVDVGFFKFGVVRQGRLVDGEGFIELALFVVVDAQAEVIGPVLRFGGVARDRLADGRLRPIDIADALLRLCQRMPDVGAGRVELYRSVQRGSSFAVAFIYL